MKETTQEPPKVNAGEVVTSPVREFIAATTQYPYFQGDRALPRSIDDAERDFGDDIYDKMLNDAMIAGTVDGLIVKVLEGGLTIAPAINGTAASAPDPETGDPEEQAEYERAEEVAEFVRFCFRWMGEQSRRPVLNVLWEVIRDAYCKGHKLCELCIELAESGPYTGKMVLTAIKPKPRKNYVFVLDGYNNFRGVIAMIPGVSIMQRQGLIWDLSTLPNAVDPRKLFILTFGSKDGNPQGSAVLRPAYDPWYRKQLGKPEEVRTAVNFGGGKITGTVGPNASPQPNSDGTAQTPEQNMADQLAKLATSGGVAAFSAGAEVQVWYPQGDGKFFDAYFSRCNNEMVFAIVKQTRSILEAEHGSKADSQTAENMQDSLTQHLRERTAETMELQIVRTLVELNWSDAETIHKYLPKVLIGGVAQPDFAANVDSLSKAGFKLHRSQFPEIDRKYKLPKRNEEQEARDDDEAQQQVNFPKAS